ncbi:cytidylate kinase-like family protein [Treponema rectale]|uniref:Cytidylate kinase n=1 Tax=Treponema rectale TaxID=744512 RepID=A0A840SIK5_9SPIR|nr:cytidylate kinase-like family protein [Treponema rectale]MBB5219222.1 cytidylate kinase [Treponema rectale]QOS40885.1 cytidylate kinase-like family protein [Treponema rectale]
MAVITITRQIAARGDEIAVALAERLNYKFIDRKTIEKKIVELGFSEKKLPKYDERKPGFFANLTKDRDEYLNYLQVAVLDAASQDNVILIGRGAFVILQKLVSLVPLKFYADDSVRVRRLQEEFSIDEKHALARIAESDTNRKGFHRSFFDVDNDDPRNFLLTVNTGVLSIPTVTTMVEDLVKNHVTPRMSEEGCSMCRNLLKTQRLVNTLIFDYNVNINYLHADVDETGKIITLQGVADSHAVVEHAVTLSAKILPDCVIKSAVSVVQDSKKFHIGFN